MTVPSRGARSRRSGRRPGWLLVTALLVLAILASSTLVFTNRVDLLRLAVILSLWAAVVAAFVSVSYRRQSELDQARARDMKFVYDLQLDREVSARREYELAVEAHLRRQLARELRAQAADEMAALRAELAALRANLEVMIGTDLGERPALESERVFGARPEAERVVIEMSAPPGRVASSRITPGPVEEDTRLVEETDTAALESPIIDVPEEPLIPPPAPAPQPQEYRGSHRRAAEGVAPQPVGAERPAHSQPTAPEQPEAPWRPPEVRRGRHWSADEGSAPASPEPVAPRSVVPQSVVPQSVVPESADPQSADPQSVSQHTGGHSVADLMSRLQVNGPVGGGGRRRRED